MKRLLFLLPLIVWSLTANADDYDPTEFNNWIASVTADAENDLKLPDDPSLIVRPETFGAKGFKEEDILRWLWDGLTNEGVTSPTAVPEAWIEFNLKHPTQLAIARLWQDNGGAHVTSWKMAKLDAESGEWVDMFPYHNTTGAGWDQVEFDDTAQRIRVYARCEGNKPSIHELECWTQFTTTPPDTFMESLHAAVLGSHKAYNLSGQRVDSGYRGVVIANQRKYLQR